MNELFLFFILIIGAKAYANEIPLGNPNALVQIEMYSDFQCPFTKRGFDNLKEILKDDSLSSNLTLKNFPLDFHDQAKLAAKMSVCADEQNKYWEVVEGFFDIQKSGSMDEKKLNNVIKLKKLDQKKFQTCMAGMLPDKILGDDKRDAQKYKVEGTPYIIIHGPKGDKVLSGAYPVLDIKKAINEVL